MCDDRDALLVSLAVALDAMGKKSHAPPSNKAPPPASHNAHRRPSHKRPEPPLLKSNLVSGFALLLVFAGFVLAKYDLRRRVRVATDLDERPEYRTTTAAALSTGPALRLAQRGCGKYPRVPGCSPSGAACGHMVVDNFASAEEVAALRAIADRGMALGGGAGGPTILDLQSGAVSYGDKFIDVYVAFNTSGQRAYRRSDVAV